MGNQEEDINKFNEPITSLNSVCPYYTMFPLDFPLSVLKSAKKGDWVIDPFCGRGTTNYAARLRNLNSIGIDSNPVAVAVSQAKLLNVKPSQIVSCCKHILLTYKYPEVPSGDFWDLCFQKETLRDLCRLREALLDDSDSQVRKALRAIMLGALHGPLSKQNNPNYFSNQMPRTYSSKPRYSVRYWRKKGFQPPKMNFLGIIKKRAIRHFSNLPKATKGHIIHGDSRLVNLHPHINKASWVITSPPYLGMRTYIPDQWLRNWFLGGSEEPTTSSNFMQLNHFSPEQFAHDLSLVWRNIAGVCRDDAKMIIRFGGIRDRDYNPASILKKSIKYSKDCGWSLNRVNEVAPPKKGKRQANQFNLDLSSPIDEFDFYIHLDR